MWRNMIGSIQGDATVKAIIFVFLVSSIINVKIKWTLPSLTSALASAKSESSPFLAAQVLSDACGALKFVELFFYNTRIFILYVYNLKI